MVTFCWPCISVYLSQYLTNLTHKICFTISFISCLYMFQAHVLIITRSKLHYTASGIITLKTSELSKITKIQFYKYEQIVVKFMCEFFGCDYCVLLTIKMLCHVEVMFIQLLNLLERYYVYLHLYDLWLDRLIKHTLLEINGFPWNEHTYFKW